MTFSNTRIAPYTLAVMMLSAVSGDAIAAESGAGFYLLGTRGPAAAILPPAGVFFQNDFYYYQGSLDAGKQLPVGGQVVGGVDAAVAIDLPTLIWVTPWDLVGGKFALSATLPVGWKDVSATASLVGPGGGAISRSVGDDTFTVGDPVISAMTGWNSGNFYWQTGVMVNVPIGDYQKGELANIAFHHWGADVYAAGTYFDPATGLDISAAVGITFNAENAATDYRTGNEFHFEWAVSKQFNEQFSAGIIGYYYNQLTGDSGDGARLGDFKGEVAAIGATIGYNFKVGETPVSSRLKVYHEFGAKNRAEGTGVFATISIPLAITPPTEISAAQ